MGKERTENEVTYTFRKSAFDKSCLWTVAERGLLCVALDTRQEHTIAYAAMYSVRLQFQPGVRYRPNNYLCRIISTNAMTDILSTSYLGFSEFSDQPEAYTRFVKALVKKVKAVNPDCQIHIGQPRTVFNGNLILILAAVALLYVLSYHIPLSGSLFGIILLLMAAWSYLKMSFAVNLPQRIAGDEIPDHVLPQQSAEGNEMKK